MRLYIVSLAFLILFAQTAYASHQVEQRSPESIVTTVGKFTSIQIDIKNSGSTTESYQLSITAASPNEIEITNPAINTQPLSPGETLSLFSNVRTLTENTNILSIKIYRAGDLSHSVDIPAISVKSKKFSLPEFGLAGFLQIIALASVALFLFKENRINFK